VARDVGLLRHGTGGRLSALPVGNWGGGAHIRATKEARMASALASSPSAGSRLSERLASLGRPAGAGVRRLGGSSRAAATVSLAAVIASAALAFAFSPAPKTAAKQVAGVVVADAGDGAAVKMIGAAPRGENCADQVWPYIERRCLVRGIGRPQTKAAPGVPDATGDDAAAAAPAESARVSTPPVERRVATLGLGLPPPLRSEGATWPPGARSDAFGFPGARVAEDAWPDRAVAPWVMMEPRQRIGRRGHGARVGRSWGRRHFFPF
jgi:hypothetical protein